MILIIKIELRRIKLNKVNSQEYLLPFQNKILAKVKNLKRVGNLQKRNNQLLPKIKLSIM